MINKHLRLNVLEKVVCQVFTNDFEKGFFKNVLLLTLCLFCEQIEVLVSIFISRILILIDFIALNLYEQADSKVQLTHSLSGVVRTFTGGKYQNTVECLFEAICKQE